MKKMVKFGMIFTAALMLIGCTNETEKEVASKTCTLEQDGLTQTFTLTATNDEIDKVDLSMVYDNEMFGVDTLSTLSDDQKKQIKDNMLSTLGLESGTYEGLEIIIEIQDQMKVTLKADLTKADSEILKKLV